MLTRNADNVCFQEIFSEKSLRDVIEGAEANAADIPDRSKRYAHKAIFRKLAHKSYCDAGLAFTPNANDGGPFERRPGVAILSRFGFLGAPEVMQDLPEPLQIPFNDLDGSDRGHYSIKRLSRPVLKARIPVGNAVITVFN